MKLKGPEANLEVRLGGADIVDRYALVLHFLDVYCEQSTIFKKMRTKLTHAVE